MSVEVGKHDDNIYVSAETKDPAEAPIIAQAVVDAYILYQTTPKESSLDNILAALGKSRDDANTQLTGTVVDMTELETRYGISPGSDSNNPVLLRVSDLEKNLDAATTDLLKAQSDYEAASKALPPPPQLVNGDSPPDDPNQRLLAATADETLLHAQLAQKQQTLTDDRQLWGARNPRAPGRRTSTSTRSANSTSPPSAGARIWPWPAATSSSRAWRRLGADAANKLNAATQHYKRLALQAQDQQKAVAQFDSRISDMERARDTGSVDITVAAPPGDATQSAPAAVPRSALGLAMILGILLAWAGMGAVATAIGSTIGCMARRMSARGWGSSCSAWCRRCRPASAPPSPRRKSPSTRPAKSPRRSAPSAPPSISARPRIGPRRSSSPAPRPATARPPPPPTSPSPWPRRAANAWCLVDADLRHPQQHAIFGARDRIGLASLLSRASSTLDQAHPGDQHRQSRPARLRQDVRKIRIELLNSSMFVELLETLAERYDQVVVDSPPVMGLADARIIAASCDLTVMVLRAQKSTRKLQHPGPRRLAGRGRAAARHHRQRRGQDQRRLPATPAIGYPVVSREHRTAATLASAPEPDTTSLPAAFLAATDRGKDSYGGGTASRRRGNGFSSIISRDAARSEPDCRTSLPRHDPNRSASASRP